MASVLAQVVLPHVSGLPENNVVNTFAFNTPSVGIVDTELGLIGTDIIGFYNTPGGGSAVGSYLGEQISRSLSARIQFYDLTGHLDGTPHGSPVFETDFGLIASGAGQELPSELAVCLSFNALYGTDPEFGPLVGGARSRPRARDRGRIYLGPLHFGLGVFDATQGEVRVSTTARTDIKNSAVTLRDSANSAWGVWSRANGVIEPVSAVWVDDAFDVQRRRGVKASARTAG